MKKLKTTLLFVLLAALLVSCADTVRVEECLTEEPYGFFSGFWHGAISFFSWIGSLFSGDISIYAVNNNGGWYDFGFIVGIGMLSSGTTIKLKS